MHPINETYEKLMKKCLQLAKKGEGKVAPNPLVGALVVNSQNEIISTGYHKKFGGSHAEVCALKNLTPQENLTLIVNLEPCSHFGKTPPCVDLIIEKKIKTVVIGVKDPNPLVDGIVKLKNAGIKVIDGVLEDECKKINEFFFKNHTRHMPFVAIKTATTLDGKIATKTGSSKWITSEKSRNYVQKLRSKYDAILTSSNTVIADNPGLDCRLKNGRNPIRIIVDTNLKTDPKSKIYKDDGVKVYIARQNFEGISAATVNEYGKNVEFIDCPLKNGRIDLQFLFEQFYKLGITSVLIEAGAKLNGAILKENLVDKIYQFIAPKVIADEYAISWASGFDVNDINNALNLKIEKIKFLKPDILVVLDV